MKIKMPHVLPEEELLNKAFSSARKESPVKIDPKMRVDSIRDREKQRILAVSQVIKDHFEDVLSNTPRIEELPPFYFDMVSFVVDIGRFKKSLAALKWAKEKTQELSLIYRKKLKSSPLQLLAGVRAEFYGREASVIKQVKKDLEFLETARSSLRQLPDIRDEPSVVLTGFPNVGKSSLLKHLTGAKPEIQPYPFTTKGVLLGYVGNRLQMLDTPGLLERPKEKRNKIELKAISAIKNIASIIVFVFDASEAAGSKEDQVALFKTISGEFDAKTIVCINKIDSSPSENIDFIEKNTGATVFRTSCVDGSGTEELKDFLLKNSKTGMKSYRIR